MCVKLKKPTIALIATGGTIAGRIYDENKHYKAGVVDIDYLLDSMPKLKKVIKKIANITTIQLTNIDSADMTSEVLLKLAKKVNELLLDSSISGVVIAHGTDTMEESAYLLHLSVQSTKPIVFTGSMRPTNAMGYDGYSNLYNAILLASNADSSNRGVMIAMNDRIQSARMATKIHNLNLDSFASLQSGDMGYIANDKIFFHYKIESTHTAQSEFDISKIDFLPRVDIIYSYEENLSLKALLKSNTKGIVIAGSGNGSIHKSQQELLESALNQGIVVVRSSRINGAITFRNDGKFVDSLSLNPQKARVLLQLALTKTSNTKDIINIFAKY